MSKKAFVSNKKGMAKGKELLPPGTKKQKEMSSEKKKKTKGCKY